MRKESHVKKPLFNLLPGGEPVRRHLEELRSSNQEALRDHKERARAAVSPNSAEAAGERAARQLMSVQAAQEEMVLEMIGQALLNLKEGRYGLCAECGQPISAERLEALPYALRCVACQTRGGRSS